MGQQLVARLGEGEIAEFVEYDKIEARSVIGEPAATPGSGLASRRLTRSTVLKKRPRIFARRSRRGRSRAGAISRAGRRSCFSKRLVPVPE